MKKFYTIILLATLNFSFAQDPLLFNTTWYLHNVVVNGVDNIPPTSNMNLHFFTPTDLTTDACNIMFGSVAFENNTNQFSFSNYAITLNFCNNTELAIYQEIYFPVFIDGVDSGPPWSSYLTYSISEFEGIKTLIINSAFNKQAIYKNVMLSKERFKSTDFSFYPNPSEDSIEINIHDAFSKNTVLEIYNELGILCKTENLISDKTRMELRDFGSGIYFLKIKTNEGTTVKKLIKK